MNNEHEKSAEMAFAQGYQKGKADMLKECSKPLSDMVGLYDFIKISLDCKTPEELLEHMARESDYDDWAALRNEISGDQELVDFYLKIFASLYAKEVLTLVARTCIIQDNNWHKTITQEDVLQIRDSI